MISAYGFCIVVGNSHTIIHETVVHASTIGLSTCKLIIAFGFTSSYYKHCLRQTIFSKILHPGIPISSMSPCIVWNYTVACIAYGAVEIKWAGKKPQMVFSYTNRGKLSV